MISRLPNFPRSPEMRYSNVRIMSVYRIDIYIWLTFRNIEIIPLLEFALGRKAELETTIN